MKEADDEKFVRELFEKAGQRPAIPPEELRGIVESARAIWVDRYGRRRRLWLLPVAAAIVVGFVALWWNLRPQPEVPPVAAATTVDRTTLMPLAGEQTLRVAAGTRIRVVSDSLVELEEGAIYLDSPPGSAHEKVAIRTFAGDFTPVGTQFEVRVNEENADLRVREGVVALVRKDGGVTAGAGEELIVRRDGTITRSVISTFDPSWTWAVDVAPMPEIEGRTLRTFLEWFAREKGLKLKFADDRTSSLGDNVILHGSIAQLTPDQALQTISISSRFSYRIDGDALIINSP